LAVFVENLWGTGNSIKVLQGLMGTLLDPQLYTNLKSLIRELLGVEFSTTLFGFKEVFDAKKSIMLGTKIGRVVKEGKNFW